MRKHLIKSQTFGLLAGFMIMLQPTEAKNLSYLLPPDINGYRSDGQDEQVDAEGLFQLIDGGAEVYRALQVRQVMERRYVKPNAPDILVDLFDMGSSAGAFGAYHHDIREGASADIGQDSELQGANLSFWKGNYFVSVVPLRTTKTIKTDVLALGRAIAENISKTGSPPALLNLLPKEGLVKSQIHFFYDWSLLSRLLFLEGKNPFKLGQDTQGLLARYRLENKSDQLVALLLIKYSSQEKAQAAFESFEAWAQQNQAIFKKIEQYLWVVLESKDPKEAQRWLETFCCSKQADRVQSPKPSKPKPGKKP